MKGICFTEEMFNSVIKGNKTQTRRLIKPRLINRYNIGDIIYLKEPYVDDYINGAMFYKYDKDDLHKLKIMGYEKDSYKRKFWHNKLFMPECYARYFIEIINIRRERLQEISDEDCFAEGVQDIIGTYYYRTASEYFNVQKNTYKSLIDKINGKGTWNSNPEIWVYEFKKVDR